LAAASAQVSSPVALDPEPEPARDLEPEPEPEPEPELCKMLMLLLLLLLLACSPWRAAAAPAQYEVTQLPGTGPLRTRMWSGFSAPGVAAPNGNGEVVFHYVVVEADVPHPETAATLVWYNGGPGQSGLFGLFVEIGPLLLNLDSQIGDEYLATGVPQLQPNPHSWNKVANIVVVNSPAPTGFSYCTGAGVTGDGTSCGMWNDTYVAMASAKFLHKFFEEDFPEYSSNDLFLVGESYGGI
jgi:hypothetical protein